MKLQMDEVSVIYPHTGELGTVVHFTHNIHGIDAICSHDECRCKEMFDARD